MNKRILLLAYMVSPTKGSEYSVAWNYIVHMSKRNRLTVLCGATGDHMGDLDEIETMRSTEGLENVEFVPIRPDKRTELLNRLNRKGILPYTFYLAYRRWH